MYNRYKAKELLIEDLENKKPFQANFDSKCYFGCQIIRGDDFYFMGDKRKVCASCRGELQEEMNNL